MSELKEFKKEMFMMNNGTVLRRINLLRTKYATLAIVKRVCEKDGIKINEFLDCINFLSEEGYITLRENISKIETRLSDAEDYADLEAKVTSKGIRLLAGSIKDELVEV